MTSARKVLLIDDDEAVLVTAKQLLENHGMSAMVYSQTFNRTGFVVAERPDLLLVDVNMPFLPGDELVKLMRQTPSLRDLPVVLFSSNDESTLRRMVRDTGAAGYIPKSSLGHDFAARVSRFLTSAPAEPAATSPRT